jgi:hypothetical protein
VVNLPQDLSLITSAEHVQDCLLSLLEFLDTKLLIIAFGLNVGDLVALRPDFTTEDQN